jgi:glycosyltransferase involved in cell wall biosynthesis/SAM-dependent methyltransferase
MRERINMMQRLLLADRVKGRSDTFLAPLLPSLERHYEIRFISTGPGEELAAAIAWADVVWLEWCWDHAVWATREVLPAGKPCILRLHSIEVLQTNYPSQVDWRRVSRLVTVADDITETLLRQFPSIAGAVPIEVIANGIDTARFRAGSPDRFRVAWVGHLEPKKNPMLLMQIALLTHQHDPRFAFHVAGAFTDLRTSRYLSQMQQALGLAGVVHFEGHVADMPTWYADKGTLLSTSMYESFGMNIGEAMAVGAFPVVHRFPGAERLWPEECLFASVADAVALIGAARPGLYREWVEQRYGLSRQVDRILTLLRTVLTEPPRAGEAVPFVGSAAYWDRRYLQGGNSGAGSRGRLAAFKAATVNRLVKECAVASVLEFGCGDGGQLALANYPTYVGVDVSPASIALCRERFAADPSKRFLLGGTDDPGEADLVLSFDVIFHLVEDDVFHSYMRSLFARARRFVAIYASDRDERTADEHVRHRPISAWVAEHAPQWERITYIANPYPHDAARPDETSFSDFHIFARHTAEPK